MPPTLSVPVDRADGTGADCTVAGATGGQAQVLYYSLANIGGADYDDTTAIVVPSALRIGNGALPISAAPGRYRAFALFDNAAKASEPFEFSVTGTAPTLGLADNEDGTGAVATIAGSQAAQLQRLVVRPLAGGAQTLHSRTGDGTIALSLAVGDYAVFALLDTGAYELGPYLLQVTDADLIVAPTNGYCTAADVYAIVSQFKAEAQVDDDYDDAVSAGEATWLAQAIERGSAWIDMLLGSRYQPSTYSANRWVRWAAAYLAACELERRRGNPVAKSLLAETQNYLDMMKAIAAGGVVLSGVNGPEPENGAAMPGIANVTMDLRYHYPKVRAVRSTSGRRQPISDHDAPDAEWGPS